MATLFTPLGVTEAYLTMIDCCYADDGFGEERYIPTEVHIAACDLGWYDQFDHLFCSFVDWGY